MLSRGATAGTLTSKSSPRRQGVILERGCQSYPSTQRGVAVEPDTIDCCVALYADDKSSKLGKQTDVGVHLHTGRHPSNMPCHYTTTQSLLKVYCDNSGSRTTTRLGHLIKHRVRMPSTCKYWQTPQSRIFIEAYCHVNVTAC
jgi:hypothetical protein